MSTTTGDMNKFNVTDKLGNVYSLDPVDAQARQEIDEAKNLQFDENFFTAEETDDEVSVGLNGVPLGIDETLQFVQDNSEGIVLGVNVTTENNRITAIGDMPIAATTDANGNDIGSTYATKSALNSKQPLFYDAGALTDGATVNVHNNAIQQLTSSQSELTLNVDCDAGEVPNFTVELSPSNALTLAVTKTVDDTVSTLYPSVSGGTSLESGNYYQVNCLGNCWTLLAFTANTPSPIYTYNYILLVNFIDQDIFPDTVEGNNALHECNTKEKFDTYSEEYADLYETSYFGSDSPSSILLDNRCPVDFSSKGVSGNTPFGICALDDDYSYHHRYTSVIPANSVFTYELWYAAATGDYQDSQSPAYPALGAFQVSGSRGYFQLSLEVAETSGDTGAEYFSVNVKMAEFDQDVDSKVLEKKFYVTEETYDTVQASFKQWHHYAVTCDGTNLRLFFDGELAGTYNNSNLPSLIGGADLVFWPGFNEIPSYGRFAQIAVCDECKWTSDFTVPTVAYTNQS